MVGSSRKSCGGCLAAGSDAQLQLEIKGHLGLRNGVLALQKPSHSLTTLTHIHSMPVCVPLVMSLGGFSDLRYFSRPSVPATRRVGSWTSLPCLRGTATTRPSGNFSPLSTRSTLPVGHSPPHRKSHQRRGREGPRRGRKSSEGRRAHT